MIIIKYILATLAILFVIGILIFAFCLCKISGTHNEDDELAWELLKNQPINNFKSKDLYQNDSNDITSNKNVT